MVRCLRPQGFNLDPPMVPDVITLTGENEKVIKSIIDRIAVAMMDDMGRMESKDFRDNGSG